MSDADEANLLVARVFIMQSECFTLLRPVLMDLSSAGC